MFIYLLTYCTTVSPFDTDTDIQLRFPNRWLSFLFPYKTPLPGTPPPPGPTHTPLTHTHTPTPPHPHAPPPPPPHQQGTKLSAFWSQESGVRSTRVCRNECGRVTQLHAWKIKLTHLGVAGKVCVGGGGGEGALGSFFVVCWFDSVDIMSFVFFFFFSFFLILLF